MRVGNVFAIAAVFQSKIQKHYTISILKNKYTSINILVLVHSSALPQQESVRYFVDRFIEVTLKIKNALINRKNVGA